jgi:excisionase family DNA binding protein
VSAPAAHPTRATEIATLLGRLAELMSDGHSESPHPPPRPMPERVLLTVEEAAEQLGIGRTLAYKLVSSGEIESIRIGRLRRVPTAAIQDYARRLSGMNQADTLPKRVGE